MTTQRFTFKQFQKFDIRVGTIIKAQPSPDARVPSFQLEIDFGELGRKRTSARITDHYTPGELVGRQVLGVVNFPPKRIGKFVSEVLVLGGYESDNSVRLLIPEQPITNGAKLK
ncbi:MAG: tRNA-binding protein [Candidatus Marinimicrobia bacterium]|nr:tRNA-binding protein [Candidatus Neomarinimicrobiota bacterium]